MQDYEYLLSSLKKVKGIGSKTIQLFFKKKIISEIENNMHQVKNVKI